MVAYIGKSELTIARTPSGTQVYIYKGQGVDGAVIDPKDLDRLVKGGYLGKATETAEPAELSTAGEKPATVEEILAAVGDDADLAQTELNAELAKDKPRKGLIEKLEATIAKATA